MMEAPADRALSPATTVATWALLVFRVIVVSSVVLGTPHYPTSTSDRYTQVAHEPGRPYADVEVEYAPGELGVATLVGSGSTSQARIRLALLAVAADLVAFFTLRRYWSRAIAFRYLWLGLPLLLFMYRRSDLVVVAMSVLAIAVSRRRRSATAGSLLAVAVLTRLWPAILTPIWLIERRVRELWVFAAVTAGGVFAWAAFGGVDALRQVSSFRGATGWELESTVGVIVWALTGEHRFESGANRTGHIPDWASLFLLILLVSLLVLVWWKGSRGSSDLAGATSLAAVATLLVVSPLLSPQYVIWLLPWIAIAGRSARRWSIMGFVPLLLTGTVVAGWYLDLALGAGRDQLILFLRNASLVAIVVAYLMPSIARDPTASAGRRDVVRV